MREIGLNLKQGKITVWSNSIKQSKLQTKKANDDNKSPELLPSVHQPNRLRERDPVLQGW